MAKSFRLSGETAVITGAASGIGAALARALAARGCHLALADLNLEGLASTAAACRAAGVRVSEHRLDVGDAAQIAALPQAVLAEHGGVGVLINNAGVAVGGLFEDVSEEDFEWLMDINFWGGVRMTRAFLPLLRERPAAQIVNLSSIFGIIAPIGQTAYCASKFAIRGFSESLRHELEDTSIGVTIVHPGGVRTAIADSARIPAGLAAAEVEQHRSEFKKMLKLSAEDAATIIVRAIERRAPRVLVGQDASQAATVQRLFPVRYWSLIRRTLGSVAEVPRG